LAGAVPGPCWGSLQCSSDTLAGFEGGGCLVAREWMGKGRELKEGENTPKK